MPQWQNRRGEVELCIRATRNILVGNATVTNERPGSWWVQRWANSGSLQGMCDRHATVEPAIRDTIFRLSVLLAHVDLMKDVDLEVRLWVVLCTNGLAPPRQLSRWVPLTAERKSTVAVKSYARNA